MVLPIKYKTKPFEGSKQKITLNTILDKFVLSKDKVTQIMDSIRLAFKLGLLSDEDSFLYHPIKMLNTHLMVIPTGRECGSFVALDLGGTNLRIHAISIVDGKLSPDSRAFKVPQSIQTGTGEKLFDYLAARIDEGLVELGFKNVDVEFMGFTFSFPCHQNSLNSGELIRWTKGYTATGVENRDIVAMLRDACFRKSLKIRDFVLVNDTTGTLLSGAFESPDCVIGVIVGTGTNACYLEKIVEVKKWEGPSTHEFVVINTEWGSFGENGELNSYSTDFDSLVDQESINPRCQKFEKMISGMYVGNIVRHVIINASDNGLIFNGKMPDDMKKQDSFPSSLTSDVYTKEVFIQKFKQIFNYELSDDEYSILFNICDSVIQRAAALCGAGLSALILRMNRRYSRIAADGSMFVDHAMFKKYVKQYMRKILPTHMAFKIVTVKDGSGKGAALAACVVKEYLRTNQHQ